MTREALAEIGRAMFGTNWQTDLARALGCNVRTVRRWSGGEYEIPAKVETAVMALAGQRMQDIARMAGVATGDQNGGR